MEWQDWHELMEKLAHIVLDGQKAVEASYDPVHGRTTLDPRKAFEVEIGKHGLDPKFAELLDLANYWGNDIADWADEILDPEAAVSRLAAAQHGSVAGGTPGVMPG